MRLFFINRFYYPDFSATSQLLTDLTTRLTDQYDVTVVTSRTLYNDPLAELQRQDEHQGVNILRLNSTRMGRGSLFGRLLDYASFYLRVILFLFRYIGRGDIVVLETDPPLLSLINTAVVRMRGGKVINWLQDLFPDIAVELGAFPRCRILTRSLKSWRNLTLKKALVNVVISESMKAHLANQSITNTCVIPNWADGDRITPIAHEQNPIRHEWNPQQQFLVGYSGNFGRAHSFDELLEAMALLQNREEIRFVLIGEGAGLENLLQAVERKRLTHVSFRPYQPHDNLRQSLGAIDLHVVSLKKQMEGLVFPSKIYGVLAAGRPIAFIGDEAGEIADLVRNHEIGFVIGHGHGAELAEQIQALAMDSQRLHRMGANSRTLFDREYASHLAIERWRDLLAEASSAIKETTT